MRRFVNRIYFTTQFCRSSKVTQSHRQNHHRVGSFVVAIGSLLFQLLSWQLAAAQSVVGKGHDAKYGSSYAAMNHMTYGLDLLAEGTPDALHYARQNFIFIIEMKEDQGLKPEAYLNLGNVDMLEGNITAAIKDFLAALELKPGWPEAYFNLGSAYYKLGNSLKKSEESFLKALELRPHYGRAHYSLGFVYFDQKKYDLAKQHAENAIEHGVHFKSLKEKLARVGR
jgi:tetratricopeptide (TPR) repeat protein